MRFQGFIGPSYTLRSVNADCQRCVNLYPEMDEMHTEKDGEVGSLIGTPGLSLLATLGSGPIRGQFKASNGALYVLSGNTLYIVGSNWSATSIGTINSSSGLVSMADNGIALVLVDQPDGWTTVLGSTTLTQITDPLWLGAGQVAYQDGVFIFRVPNTNQFFTSNQLATTISGAFDAKASSPDKLVGIISDHRNLWLFGEETTEVWFDAGNAPPATPFSIIQGGYIETGCAAAFSIAKLNNAILFLGKDKQGSGVVYQMSGYQPQRISTHAVELAIQSYGDLSNASAWVYQENGHNFYCLNFPNANTTWVFDMATGLWHERCYTNQGLFERHRVQCHTLFNGVQVVGDYQNGNLYKLSSDVYSDNGSAISRQRVAPHISKDMVRIFFSSFQLDLEPGTGIDGLGQGISPQAVLQFSNDGGHTWSNEYWASTGAIGQTRRRAIWRRLGSARDRIFRITITDPIKVVLIGAELILEQGVA